MQTTTYKPEAVKNGSGVAVFSAPATRVRIAWYVLFTAALVFVAAGGYAIARGVDARSEVQNQLAAEKIVTPEDASIPNTPVTNHVTAHAQADVIQKHMFEATGGKTYAELDREDPARATALTAATLRSMLLSAALAFHTSELVIGIGLFIAGIGALMLLALVLLRPKFLKATA